MSTNRNKGEPKSKSIIDFQKNHSSDNIPQLRFPEFEGEWERKKLGEVLTIGSGRDYKHLGEGEIPVFGTGGLMTKVDDYLYDGETVCIGRKGTIDKPMYFDGKIWTVDTLFYTHSFINSTPKFVYNLFQRVNWKQHNEAGGVPSLSKSTIEQIELVLPTLPEQTKIASFLTVVDEKIQALKKKHSLLEQYKKGVMQRIFSNYDENEIDYENYDERDENAQKSKSIKVHHKNHSSRLRFKDENGNDFPEWEVKKLGEVLEIQGGFAFKSNLFNQGNIKVLRIGDIIPNIETLKFGGAFSSEIPDKKYLVKKNDFVMALSGATFGKVGKIIDEGIAYINQRVALFRTSQCLEYFFQLVQTDDFKNYINSIPTASAQPNISNSDILKYETIIPTIAEQTAIAHFLSALDEKINQTQTQIEKTEAWKKGLLQKMFV